MLTDDKIVTTENVNTVSTVDVVLIRGGSVRYTVPGVPYRIPYRKLRYDKNHTDTVP